MSEQEKLEKEFEEWFKKECGFSSNESLVLERIHLWARHGYFQACRKRQEKFNTFYQGINEDQAKLATHLNLPGDGRMLSEQVIEAFGKEKEEIERLKEENKRLKIANTVYEE